MDLTHDYPRSAKQKMAGIDSLARMTDKARAATNGTLGDYHYDCPHDKPVLAFLGVDAATFERKAASSNDAEIERWVREDLLKGKSSAHIAAFNEDRENWRPDPGSDTAAYFDQTRQSVAPDRRDIKTWFDLLDLDEKRPVEHAHA